MPDFGWRRDIRALPQSYDLAPCGSVPVDTTRHTVQNANKDEFPIYPSRSDFHACAASAVAAAIHLWRKNHDGFDAALQPSVRFLYYVGRYVQCREQFNNGASIFATLRAAREIGYVAEKVCPLNEASETGPIGTVASWNQPPNRLAFDQADGYGVTDFKRINRADAKYFLLQGLPVIFGMLVDTEFQKPANLVKDIVKPPRAPVVDRHCLLAVGFSDEVAPHFIARDPIDPRRGEGGYIRVSEDYILRDDWCDDFWVVTGVARDDAPSTHLAAMRKTLADRAHNFRGVVMQAYDDAKRQGIGQTRSLPLDRRPHFRTLVEERDAAAGHPPASV
jgi:hypothetical protein